MQGKDIIKGVERMTKRFTIEPTTIKECIVDNTTNEQLDTFNYTERLCEVLNELADENEILKKTYDVTEDVNTALSEENEELHLLHEELIDKNNSLHKDVSSLVDEIVNLNSKIEHLEMENQELHKLNQEYVDSLSDEKKETLSEMLNAIVGDDVE